MGSRERMRKRAKRGWWGSLRGIWSKGVGWTAGDSRRDRQILPLDRELEG